MVVLPSFEGISLRVLREGGRHSWCSPAIWTQSSARKAWILPHLLAQPHPCPRWAQLFAAALTCLGSTNRWPWVSGTVPISNVLSSCQTNVLLFSSEIMEHLMPGYKSCQLL